MTLPSLFWHNQIKDYRDFNLPIFAWITLDFVFNIVGSCALIQLLITILNDKSVNWSDIAQTARTKSSVAAITTAMGLLITIFFLLLIIFPGIIYIVFYQFALESVVLRNLRGMKALSYSKKLVKGYWWPVFGMVVLLQGSSYLSTTTLHTFIFPESIFADFFFYFLGLAFNGFTAIVSLLLFLRLEQIKGLSPDSITPESTHQ